MKVEKYKQLEGKLNLKDNIQSKVAMSWILFACNDVMCVKYKLTLTLLDLTKSYKNYLQNTQHVVLRNRPTLPIGTERLAFLNSPRGVQLGTLAYHAAGPGFEPWARRARCARFFSPPSLPSSFGR